MTDADRVAGRFSTLLHEEIGEEGVAEVLRRNAAEGNPGVCHSHDFCDANMVMWGAFVGVLGRDPDLDSDADLRLMGQAWDIAKTSRLTLKED